MLPLFFPLGKRAGHIHWVSYLDLLGLSLNIHTGGGTVKQYLSGGQTTGSTNRGSSKAGDGFSPVKLFSILFLPYTPLKRGSLLGARQPVFPPQPVSAKFARCYRSPQSRMSWWKTHANEPQSSPLTYRSIAPCGRSFRISYSCPFGAP